MKNAGRVVVFARNPERGRVKTRLAARFGEDAALALHRAFLADTMQAARAAGAEVVLAHTPGPPFSEQRDADRCLVQRGSSFGERFDAALADAYAAAPDGAHLILGADCPHLPAEAIREAFVLLRDHEAAIGPNDGHGFYALGFRGRPVPVASVFANGDECSALTELFARHGLRWVMLRERFDLDAPQDVVRLAGAVRSGDAAPPRTMAVLAALGLL